MSIFTISQSYEPLPTGAHPAKFLGVEPCETSNGKAWRWSFEVTGGAAAGKNASVLSDAANQPTKKNKTGRFLQALANRALDVGVSIDAQEYIGKLYLLVVEAKGDGNTAITTFTAISA